MRKSLPRIISGIRDIKGILKGAPGVSVSQDRGCPVLWQHSWCSLTSASSPCFISLADQIWFCQSWMPNALACVRSDASQSVPSVPTDQAEEMSLTCFVTAGPCSGGEISVIVEAKPQWQGLQEISAAAWQSSMDRQVSLNDHVQKAELRQMSSWAHSSLGVCGTVFTGFSQENASAVCGTLPEAEGVLGCGDGIQLEGCNSTPSGQHRTFNLIQGKKDVGFMPLTHGTLKKGQLHIRLREKKITFLWGSFSGIAGSWTLSWDCRVTAQALTIHLGHILWIWSTFITVSLSTLVSSGDASWPKEK